MSFLLPLILLITFLQKFFNSLLLLSVLFIKNLIMKGSVPLGVLVGLIFSPLTLTSSNSALNCVFLGYSNMHKGFKCLDVAGGRVNVTPPS
jgi:hypothetical protein